LATSSGAFSLKRKYDANVLQAMADGAGNTGTDFGTAAAPINIYTAATKGDTAVNMMLAMARALDDQSIPEENRFFVAPPAFYEALFGAGAKFAEVQVTGDGTSPLRNGLVMQGNIAGMACYKSTALNNSGTDVVTITSQDTTNDFVVLAGHMSSTATASHIAKTEVVRSTDTFSDIVRGLHVFGRKVLRPEALVQGVVATAA